MFTKNDKSEFRKSVEASLAGSVAGIGATLPLHLGVTALNSSDIKKIKKAVAASDYVYDAEKIIPQYQKLNGVTVEDKIPYLLSKGIPVTSGNKVPVDITGSKYLPHTKVVYTPKHNGKITAIGLHELGHASNFSDPKYTEKFKNIHNKGSWVSMLGSILSASQLGEDNPLIVGGTSGIIASLLAHKANKQVLQEEVNASKKALRYIVANRPDRLSKDKALLKTALGTYKKALPVAALTSGVIPLAIAYTRQRMNKGEFKKDKWIEKLLG